MPITIKEFDVKGVEATKSASGKGITASVMRLLSERDTKGNLQAFSLNEVAEASNTNLENDTENKTLMNVLYVQRIKKGVVSMKMYEGEKYYKIIEDRKDVEEDGK